MQLNLTHELAELMKFTGSTARAIRMYSAFNDGSPADYLQIARDPEREAFDLMFLSDALHHFTALGSLIQEGNAAAIVDECERLLKTFAEYQVERAQWGPRQSHVTFKLWRPMGVDLDKAISAFAAIREKVTTVLVAEAAA